MGYSRREIGRLGEHIGKKYLRQKGYELIESNYHKSWGEVDIIARGTQGETVFFEVKTRTNLSFGQPEESIGRSKQIKLIKTMDSYLNENPVLFNTEYRIDVLSIMLNFKEKMARIKHIKNAVEDLDFEY